MNKTQLDESLAFTALLEMDPVYRDLACTGGDAAARRDALLEAWYAQTEVKNFWAFARQWITTH